jgi:hypothetical protein
MRFFPFIICVHYTVHYNPHWALTWQNTARSASGRERLTELWAAKAPKGLPPPVSVFPAVTFALHRFYLLA